MKFSRFPKEKHEWSLEGKPIDGVHGQWATFENINLVVGKNATGKSKTVDTIRQLSDLLSGAVKLSNLRYDNGIYQAKFDDNGTAIDYYLSFHNGKTLEETLHINGVEKLNRAKGKMYYEEVEKFLSFQMEDDKLAVSRVDSKQQPFFERIHNWGKNLNHYRFGGQLGKDTLLRDANLIKHDKEIDLKDSGEGLDFDRSKKLIDLLIEKVKNSPVQVIMTTNDRFVMNNIPLKYWSVIDRVPKKSLLYNYRNSKETFDSFEYTGLSNFDFLSSQFYVQGFDNQVEICSEIKRFNYQN
ncbi:MAG: hypothetical protein RI894_2570 [Bacteroidota bacterium]